MPLETIGVLLSVLTPLVGVPLTVITFYLRSLREHQVTRYRELSTRLDELSRELANLRERSGDFERDYATKEEWLRECLHTRSVQDRLSATTVRLETLMGAWSGGAKRLVRSDGSEVGGSTPGVPAQQ